jgi:hypothetical protein
LYLNIKITIGSDGDNDKPPIPPTRYPIVNRLTSSIDESLVNLSLRTQDAEIEQERALYELEQIFIQFRRHIEKYFRQYEYEIKSTYAEYDQHLYELKSQLKHVRQQLIQNFTSAQTNDHDNDDYAFDINKYRYLEKLTTQTLNQTLHEQKTLPKYRMKLNNVDRLDQYFNIQCDQKSSRTASPTDDTDDDDDYDSSKDITPMERSMSIG